MHPCTNVLLQVRERFEVNGKSLDGHVFRREVTKHTFTSGFLDAPLARYGYCTWKGDIHIIALFVSVVFRIDWFDSIQIMGSLGARLLDCTRPVMPVLVCLSALPRTCR
jgi:hypothetical protein